MKQTLLIPICLLVLFSCKRKKIEPEQLPDHDEVDYVILNNIPKRIEFYYSHPKYKKVQEYKFEFPDVLISMDEYTDSNNANVLEKLSHTEKISDSGIYRIERRTEPKFVNQNHPALSVEEYKYDGSLLISYRKDINNITGNTFLYSYIYSDLLHITEKSSTGVILDSTGIIPSMSAHLGLLGLEFVALGPSQDSVPLKYRFTNDTCYETYNNELKSYKTNGFYYGMTKELKYFINPDFVYEYPYGPAIPNYFPFPLTYTKVKSAGNTKEITYFYEYIKDPQGKLINITTTSQEKGSSERKAESVIKLFY